jgi:hypothetical protein
MGLLRRSHLPGFVRYGKPRVVLYIQIESANYLFIIFDEYIQQLAQQSQLHH